MLAELYTASSLLCTALDRYVRACSALDVGLSRNHFANSAVELSHTVDNEIALVEMYKSKLIKAQVAVKRARNNRAHVPINSLPPEVLSQIFHLVLLSGEPCPLREKFLWNGENEPYFPDYPDVLSHVCSRWRQVALDSPQLWSHIDIALSCSRSKGFHDRAVVHASRARQLPLDIHFIDPGRIRQEDTPEPSENDSEEEDYGIDDTDRRKAWQKAVWGSNPTVFGFLASTSRIRSLGLDVRYRYHPIHSRALEHCLANCLPGSLSELVIDVWTSPDANFFKVQEKLNNRNTTALAMSKQQLERALRSITVLNLEGRYLKWTSAAYRGLTDLRLHGGHGEQISALDLTGILRSSPGLRTIHCDFRIVGSLESRTSATTVTLQDLETLELKSMSTEDAGCFIQLINPGLKPLRLSFRGNPTSAMLQDFFARSNVQELRIAAGWMPSGSDLPLEAFCLPPQLGVLLISQWNWDSFTQHRTVNPPIRSDTVYMLGCRFPNADRFRTAVARLSPRRLVLWKCKIRNTGNQKSSLSVFRSALGKDLDRSCTIEYLTSQDPNPVQDWSYIDL